MPYLHTPISALSGVGATRKAAYGRMGIHTVEDLLYHFPRAYEHRGDIRLLAEASEEPFRSGARMATVLTVSTEARVTRVKGRMTLCKFRAFDDSGVCEVTFFNQEYLRNTFTVGAVFRFYGKVEQAGKDRYTMTAPAFEPYTESRPLPSLYPVYPLTEGKLSRPPLWWRTPFPSLSVPPRGCVRWATPSVPSTLQRIFLSFIVPSAGWPSTSSFASLWGWARRDGRHGSRGLLAVPSVRRS